MKNLLLPLLAVLALAPAVRAEHLRLLSRFEQDARERAAERREAAAIRLAQLLMDSKSAFRQTAIELAEVRRELEKGVLHVVVYEHGIYLTGHRHSGDYLPIRHKSEIAEGEFLITVIGNGAGFAQMRSPDGGYVMVNDSLVRSALARVR